MEIDARDPANPVTNGYGQVRMPASGARLSGRRWPGRMIASVLAVLVVGLAVFVVTPLHSVMLRGPLDVSTADYSGASAAVLQEGILVGRTNGTLACFWLKSDGGTPLFVTWPSGWSAAQNSSLVIVDDWGRPFATEGDRIEMGGWAGAPAPDGCS